MMATDTATTPADEFVGRLETLTHRDAPRADLARLRRCAGRSLAECPEVFGLFYRLLPYPVRGDDREEERYFLVATLFALDPRLSSARDFGASMRAVAVSRGAARKELDEGVSRRMAVLLDAPGDDLAFRLRQVVALAASADMGINWRSLLSDLLWWDHPNRRVQRAWARSYFGGAPAPAPEQTTSAKTIESED
jgi:CRISPR system Cascade subunit CasB